MDEVDPADRPQVDHDTQGVVGTPDIVATILGKIDAAAVFVADVTPIARTVPAELRPGADAHVLPAVKHVQNPNVMSELGYADRALGQGRIVLVANSARYPGPEALPFDWRHRRGPVTYLLADDATTRERHLVRRALADSLARVLQPMLQAAARNAPTVPSLLSRQPSSSDPGLWSGAEGGLRFNESVIHDERKVARLRPGPRIYARLAVAEWPGLPRSELDRRMASDGMRLWTRGSAGSSGVDADGALHVSGFRTMDDGTYEAGGLTQWFANNGEIWAVDAASFGSDAGQGHAFAYRVPFAPLVAFLTKAISTLGSISPDRRIEVELGATGLLASVFPHQSLGGGTPAVSDRVGVRDAATAWTLARRNALLLRFWNVVLDAYGQDAAPDLEAFENTVQIALDRSDES